MAMFDVFVEGPTDASPEGRRRLAELMSQRFGLPADVLAARLEHGRVRVKASIDEPTARTYARELEALGARVSIAASRGSGPVARPSGAIARAKPGSERKPAAPPSRLARDAVPTEPAKRPSSSPLLPPAGPRPAPSPSLPPSPLPPPTGSRPAPSSSLPPPTGSRPPPSSSLPPATARPATPPTGLAAAFSSEIPATALGALEQIDSLSLAALDGSDAAPEAGSFAWPIDVAPERPGAPPDRTSERPIDSPLDLFAPPDADEPALELALETEPVSTKAPPPRPSAPPAPTTPVLQQRPRSQPIHAEPAGVAVVAVVAHQPPARWRFAAGVFLAVVLGFVPAHIVASIRESSAFAEIDERVIDAQAQLGSTSAPVAYAQLPAFRDEQREEKRSARTSIALTALVIWALGGAGIAYAWFRHAPWGR